MKQTATLLILSFAALFASTAVAQHHGAKKDERRQARWEEFRQAKHAFYTEKLELTAEQAEAFFKLYDEMEQRKFELSREMRQEMRSLSKKGEAVTDAEYKAVADKAAALPEKEAAIEKEYYAKFCEILSPRQQYLYHRCEIDFQKSLIKKKTRPKEKK